MSSNENQFFKLQFVNAYSQEILREATYDSVDDINNVIKAFEESTTIDVPTDIFDNQQRTLTAKYLSHNKFTEENTMIYKLKLYFKTRIAEKQVPIQE